VSRCRKCQAEIWFLKHHETGKVNPVSATPSPTGNILLLSDGRYRILRKGEEIAGPRYVSHFVDCTNPEAFRKERSR
jgi:hypothetical protein